MWSTKARPVETSARPRPSRSTLAESCVSRLLRVIRPLLLKAHLDRVGVRAQAFHLRQPDRGVAQGLEVAAVQAKHARPLEEGLHATRRRHWRRPRCWQCEMGA